MWDNDDTSKLLTLYYENISKIGPYQKFKNKKCMWIFIAKKLSEFSDIERDDVQCENKYKNLAKARKDDLANKRKSGNEPQDLQFDAKFLLIESVDDTFDPEVRQGVGICTKRAATESDASTSSDATALSLNAASEIKPPSKKRRTPEEIAEAIFEKKEAARDRRHQEKMKLIKQIFSTPSSSKQDDQYICYYKIVFFLKYI